MHIYICLRLFEGVAGLLVSRDQPPELPARMVLPCAICLSVKWRRHVWQLVPKAGNDHHSNYDTMAN